MRRFKKTIKPITLTTLLVLSALAIFFDCARAQQFNTTGTTYTTTDSAFKVDWDSTNDTLRMRYAPAGTAGNTITWTDGPTLSSNGAFGTQGELILNSLGLTCSSTTAGALRYTSATFQACDGSSWKQIGLQAIGSTTNVVASGPPASANIYTYTATGNYTPAYGSVTNIYSGTWPADGSTSATPSGCVQLATSNAVSPQQTITADLGSLKTLGNVYATIAGRSGNALMNLGISFSTDNVTYASSTSMSNSSTGASFVSYATKALSPNVTARYIRLTNVDSSASSTGNHTLCQFAVGP